MASLSQLYADLNKFNQSQEYERAIKVTNKIITEHSGESVALHSKVICLIHLGRFDEALIAMKKYPNLSKGLNFEKAYCEYRLNKTNEALKTLREVEKPDYQTQELLAQVLYRLEQYDECYKLYKQLIKNSEDDFDEERQTNLAAVLSSLQMWTENDMEDPGLNDLSYELCYNKACLLIGKKQYKEAEEKLRKAEVLCRKSFEDDPDVTEEDISEEVALLKTQLAYALQVQGRPEEALQFYNQVLKTKPSDVGVIAVASNNIVTLNKEQNVFDSKKKIKIATSGSVHQKLTSIQQNKIKVNQGLLYMYTNQGDQVRNVIKELKDKYEDKESAVLIEAAQNIRDKQVSRAIDILKDYTNDKGDDRVKLTLAQLYLGQGSVFQACDVLKSMGVIQYTPGVVSALVTLYMSQEDYQSASKVFDDAVNWCKTKPKSDDLMILMRANANFHMKHGDPKQAAFLLEQISQNNPKDSHILAQLFSAYSLFDPQKAQQMSRQLPSVDEIISGVDVDDLEKAFGTMGPKYLKKLQKPEPSPATDGIRLIQMKKKKKKKKTKFPKNYDPNVTPDPERWLPRRERSYYRGKRKDKNKNIGKGTQGATTPSGDIDASKQCTPGSGASSPRPAANPTKPSPQPLNRQQSQASGGGRNNNNNNKKKKKSKR
ncbi:SRP72 [Acanthosepion pharaonis]|uniref:Signal recognition particle subunit SRP72 n=1 Tax=Acanthosepion pharaonis TaxID=158019 RepID=A0A812CIW4_ACAPH|nr:SRP72 [Sepia pharaonis]